MPTFNLSNVTKITIDEEGGGFSGNEISTTDTLERATDLEVTVPDGETDAESNPYFTRARVEGNVGIADTDFLFVDTLNNSNTIEDQMTENKNVDIKIHTPDGVLTGGAITIRPMVVQGGDFSTADQVEGAQLMVSHTKYDGAHRVQ